MGHWKEEIKNQRVIPLAWPSLDCQNRFPIEQQPPFQTLREIESSDEALESEKQHRCL